MRMCMRMEWHSPRPVHGLISGGCEASGHGDGLGGQTVDEHATWLPFRRTGSWSAVARAFARTCTYTFRMHMHMHMHVSQDWFLVGSGEGFRVVAYKGDTQQGPYDGAFVFTRTADALTGPDGAKLRASIDTAVRDAKLDPSQMSAIDNTCPADSTAAGVSSAEASKEKLEWKVSHPAGLCTTWLFAALPRSPRRSSPPPPSPRFPRDGPHLPLASGCLRAHRVVPAGHPKKGHELRPDEDEVSEEDWTLEAWTPREGGVRRDLDWTLEARRRQARRGKERADTWRVGCGLEDPWWHS